jgi:hypothetical protein
MVRSTFGSGMALPAMVSVVGVLGGFWGSDTKEEAMSISPLVSSCAPVVFTAVATRMHRTVVWFVVCFGCARSISRGYQTLSCVHVWRSVARLIPCVDLHDIYPYVVSVARLSGIPARGSAVHEMYSSVFAETWLDHAVSPMKMCTPGVGSWTLGSVSVVLEHRVAWLHDCPRHIVKAMSLRRGSPQSCCCERGEAL